MTSPTRSPRRRLAVVATAFALVATTLLATPAQAQVDVEDVKLKSYIDVKTNKTAAVVVGDTAWVTVSIRGKEDVDMVQFTATLDDGSVAYPTNTVDHSGPYNGYELDKKETDYVAFQVTIPEGTTTKDMKLELRATFTHDGEAMVGTDDVKIPLVVYEGDPYTLVSSALTYSTEEPASGWVDVPFVGLAPRVDSFKVSVSDPSGLDIHYPADTFTSLANDDLLEDGETDVVRFRVGETHWTETLDLEVQVQYELAGVATSSFHRLTVAPA